MYAVSQKKAKKEKEETAALGCYQWEVGNFPVVVLQDTYCDEERGMKVL